MAEKIKTILTYFVLLLLTGAIIAFGRHINSKKVSPPEEDYAKKLAELRADFTKVTPAGSKQHTSGRKSNNARST